MYGMMKPNMPGGMPGVSGHASHAGLISSVLQFPMGGPDGPLGGMGPDMPNVMNGKLSLAPLINWEFD